MDSTAKELEALVLNHMSLADAVAVSVYNTARHALELDELKSIAYLGLVSAAKRWNPYCAERGYNPEDVQYFKTFAQRRIRGSIFDEFRSADWASRTLRSRAKLLREAGQESGATVEEMSHTTGLTEKVVRSTIHDMSRRPVSMEGSDIDVPTIEADVENTVFARRVMDGMVSEFHKLSGLSQVIVALKYHQGLSMRDIAAELNLPTVKISQLHAQAVVSLHKSMMNIAEESNETEG